ncbi:hypothetical protein L484_000228 [Morus notabilis]|uniref:Uncharacterized protein n=1 Tax=Morus notabilis TaxID=981085 RepID=W9SF15_9ROSA|nr:hypothetical protein L484_000228 [Morus notabilis]
MANKDLFASVVSDLKTYAGNDPLLPWIWYNHIPKSHSIPPLSPSLRHFYFLNLIMVLLLQRNPKVESLVAASTSEGKAPQVSSEMHADLRVRSALPKRLAVPSRLVTVGITKP